ncbi:2-isopropylmalate synthase [Candidatus Daviesbacteria bacterium]|nr:2-isopropylmalate synthase [Candidatus Daviesbacteria bacterium]
MLERKLRDSNHIKIFDTTLRDGDQSPRPEGFKPQQFTFQDKVDIAAMLKKLGVDTIETGFPSSSPANFEAVSEIARIVHGPTIACLSGAVLADIDTSWRAIEPAKDIGGARLHIVLGTSPTHMYYKLEMTEDEVIAAIAKSVKRAREYTDDVEFSPEDASRSDFEFMMRAILTAVDNGATTINIPDTVGYAMPWEYGPRLGEAKRRVDNYIGKDQVVISAHCHDDLGLATANTLAAVYAGIRQVEVTINGIGERAGNTPLEEVVQAIHYRPDIYQANGRPLFTIINPNYLKETSQLVETRSGLVVQRNKAHVGANAFAHTSGYHQQGIVKHRETYEWMDPKTVGQESSFAISAQSGRAGMDSRARQLGFDTSDVEVSKGIRTKVKNYADETERAVTDTELEKIIADFKGETLINRFVLGEVEMHEVDHTSRSKITIFIDGKPHEVEEKGNGLIDAAVHAIKNATGLNIDIANYAGMSLEEGSNAKSGCTLTVKNEIKITSYAEDESVPLAAIKAYIAAVNTIDRSEQRKRCQ